MMTEIKGHSHLIDRLYEIKAKDEKGMPRSNVGGWHSHDELYSDVEFKSTVADILYKAKECFKNAEYEDKIASLEAKIEVYHKHLEDEYRKQKA